MATCPMLSTIANENLVRVDCMGKDCQCWDNFNKKCGLVPKSSQATASYLISEFMNNQDMDTNGKVYGTDFMVTGFGKPSTLISIESHPMWENPSKRILWEDYVNWSKDPDNVTDPTV